MAYNFTKMRDDIETMEPYEKNGTKYTRILFNEETNKFERITEIRHVEELSKEGLVLNMDIQKRRQLYLNQVKYAKTFDFDYTCYLGSDWKKLMKNIHLQPVYNGHPIEMNKIRDDLYVSVATYNINEIDNMGLTLIEVCQIFLNSVDLEYEENLELVFENLDIENL